MNIRIDVSTSSLNGFQGSTRLIVFQFLSIFFSGLLNARFKVLKILKLENEAEFILKIVSSPKFPWKELQELHLRLVTIHGITKTGIFREIFFAWVDFVWNSNAIFVLG